MVEKILPSAVCDRAYADADLPLVPNLPRRYVFHDGRAVVARNVRRDEDAAVYALMSREVVKGQGYGADEFPSLSVFRRLVLMTEYCVVYEDSTSGDLVGFSLLADSWYARNRSGHYGESSTLIVEKYQGRGYGKEVVLLELMWLRSLGYRVMLNDALASNYRMRHIAQKSTVVVGVLPNGTYTEGYGWDDQVIGVTDMSAVDENLPGHLSKL